MLLKARAIIAVQVKAVSMAVDEWVANSSRRQRLRREILVDKDVRCWICQQPGANQLDHIKPRSKYPELIWERSNIVPAHDTCNNAKSDSETVPGLGYQSEQW